MDRKFLPAFTVGLLLVIVWYLFGIPLIWGRPKPPEPTLPKPAAPVNDQEVKPPPVELPSAERRVDTLTAGNLKLTLDNMGAQIPGLELTDAGIDLMPLNSPGIGRLFADSLETRGWNVVRADAAGVVYEAKAANGLTLRKSYTPGETPDTLKLKLEIINATAGELPFAGRLALFEGIEHDGPYRFAMYHEAILGYPRTLARYLWRSEKENGQEVSKLSLYVTTFFIPNSKEEARVADAAATWVGLKNRYFMLAAWPAAARPEELQDFAIEAVKRSSRDPHAAEDRANIRAEATLREVKVAPGTTRALEFIIYAGPLTEERIPQSLGDPNEVINWSGFDSVGRLLHWTITRFKNLGLGIIVTTLLLRLLLSPLSIKSQSSMLKMSEMMKKLKPKLDAIRERHGDDARKMQEETMALYRAEGFNPLSNLGGCLPMFIQIPIFIGMYSVVDQSVALRHASFLWIADLSYPDATIPFPFFGWAGINILPIVMGITWTLQSFMTPITTTDPQQVQTQKMMRFMPILFVFMCYGLASGLSLYFFINSLLGIVEMKLVRTFILKPSP